MDQMKALYEKVANDLDLQKKFEAILAGAKEAGEETTNEKLLAFAKDAGYEINMEEMKEYFRDKLEKQEGEISELELDMVAGGKSTPGWIHVVGSIVFLGILCAATSMMMESMNSEGCAKSFQ